ncbi:Ig-like domain-containing protein [Cellulomonas endophytica]|uniref:Ig-like domain-containing protein n=1 Tax=Cellulomonas endophytica TaxID=2494735 RepID=UPI001013C1F2|nr:Ig-like domain-containing protein [Cellulomonas endophytica]
MFSANTNGDVLLLGNTLMTCQDAAANCAAARAGTAAALNNNSYASQFVDVDADAGTFNSSSADLTVPSGGSVLFAALVWSGRIAATVANTADPALRSQVRLTTPEQTLSLTGTRLDTTGQAYQGYIDVTDAVAAAGSGAYTVANVQSSSGGTDQYAGWSLLVAVADPSKPRRNLTVFSGFGDVTTANGGTTTISLSGFRTPPSGPVQTTLGAVTYEGDASYTGDTFKLNSTTISDALNPAANPFNSTIAARGTRVTSKNPDYVNQFGMDIDTLDASGTLANNATSATITLTTTQDVYYPGVVTFVTDLYDPQLLGTKTVVDDNGGSVEVGDTLTYTVPVENIGLDVASDSRLFDAIPTGTTYVPGSLTIDGAPVTDAVDADTAFYDGSDNGHVIAYLGAGATPTAGGDIPVSTGAPQHHVTFKVTVNNDATTGQELVNAASLSYNGFTTRAAAASATNAVISPVAGTANPSNQPPTAAPHIVAFTPSPSERTLAIPVLTGSSDPDAGDTLTVVAVTDAAGGPLTINPDGTVTYAPRDTFAGRDVFTYTLEDSAGNRSTAPVRVDVANAAPTAVDDTATTPAGTPVTVPVLTNDTDSNGDAVSVRSVTPPPPRAAPSA